MTFNSNEADLTLLVLLKCTDTQCTHDLGAMLEGGVSFLTLFIDRNLVNYPRLV